MKRKQFSRNLVINILKLNMLYFLVDTMFHRGLFRKPHLLKLCFFESSTWLYTCS
jgi:hypothetical protein